MNALVPLPVDATPVSCMSCAATAQRILSPLREREANRKALRAAGAPLKELCLNLGDGVDQAAEIVSRAISIPSLNFAPLMIFGNWF